MAFDALLEFGQLAGERSVAAEDLAESDKGAHDGNVDQDGALAAKHGRKHGDALLCERVRQIAATATTESSLGRRR